MKSIRNNREAWKYFETHGYANHDGMILHHIDMNLKTTDPERYAEWRIEDLVPMTVAEHRRLHMSAQTLGKKHTKSHNENISNGLKECTTKGKAIMIHIKQTDEQTLYFKSFASAARFIGCSRQHLSQCLRANTFNRKAMGWDVDLVDIELCKDVIQPD